MRNLAVAIGFVALAGARQGSTSQPAGLRKANIVLIVADDLGYADLGFQGCKDIPTPNIDALAQAGVRFTNAYASAPVCAPSRAALLTGRYAQRFGFEFNPEGDDKRALHSVSWPQVTVPSALQASGYATGLLGKWHLGPLPNYGPQQHGFDEFFGFFVSPRSASADGEAKVWRGKELVVEHEYISSALAREAASFIDRHKHQPFFLELAFNAPHANVAPPADLLNAFANIEDPQRRTYAAVVSALDQAIGKVLDKLRSEGLEKNTLIVFLSDNGGPTIQNSGINGSRNTPLRGSKQQLFEGGIRVPMVIAWPSRLPAGATFQEPIIQLDLMPTLLAAAGVSHDPVWKLDGVNLLPHLDGTNHNSPHEFLFWRFGDEWAVRSGNWKLVKYRDHRQAALFDLRSDVSESHDVAEDNPAIFRKLKKAWKQWDSELQAPVWPQKNE